MNGHPHLGRRSLRDKTMKNPIFLSVIAILSSVLFGSRKTCNKAKICRNFCIKNDPS